MTRGEALEILGLDSDASLDEAREAYRTLVKHYHPDKNAASNASVMFRIIQDAWEVIQDHSEQESAKAETRWKQAEAETACKHTEEEASRKHTEAEAKRKQVEENRKKKIKRFRLIRGAIFFCWTFIESLVITDHLFASVMIAVFLVWAVNLFFGWILAWITIKISGQIEKRTACFCYIGSFITSLIINVVLIKNTNVVFSVRVLLGVLICSWLIMGVTRIIKARIMIIKR